MTREFYTREALALAEKHHHGWIDKNGRPYMDRMLYVALRVLIQMTDMRAPRFPLEEIVLGQQAALLARSVEHGGTDAAIEIESSLIGDGPMPPDLARIVDAVNRRPGESLSENVRRVIAAGPVAMVVKIEDLNHVISMPKYITMAESAESAKAVNSLLGALKSTNRGDEK